MTEEPDQRGAAPVPSPAELRALDADHWARLLPHARGALHDLEDAEVDRTVELLRASPTSRLAGGRMREELAAVIAEGGPVWQHLRRRLLEARPEGLGWLIRGEPAPEEALETPSRRGPRTARPADPDDASTGERRRLRRQAKRLRRDLDAARTRAEGMVARVATLEDKLERARAQTRDARETAAALRERIDALEDELTAAVERERRRNASEVDELRDQLRERRREVHRLREELQRRDEVAARRRREEEGGEEPDQPAAPVPGGRLAVAGRPSDLPPGVRAGTAEAARALLTPGRTVLVDGYNLTITRRGHLDLEEQRRWLMNLLGRVASRFDVEPRVVFDGSRGVRGPLPSIPGVAGRFSPEGVEADDEIDLEVAAMEPDDPVLVVTDDLELRERVASHGADVVGTGPFLWAVD